MIDVQIVKQKGLSTLVKYLDGNLLKMVVLPTECIINNQASPDDLSMATPYGLPWEEIAQQKVTPQMIANKLREYNIWTLQDLEQNPNVVVGALQSVYGFDAAALRVAARRYVKSGGK